MRQTIIGLTAFASLCGLASAQQMPPPGPQAPPQLFSVMLAPGNDSVSGRLIAVAAPAASVRVTGTQPPPTIPSSGASFIAAQEAPFVSPGEATRFDADILAYPRALSRVEPGEYWVQVRLDTNHNAAYRFIDQDNDFVSVPVKMTLPTVAPVSITLRREKDVFASSAGANPNAPIQLTPGGATPAAPVTEADAHIKQIDFVSNALSEFWGRQVRIRGIVLLPPDYDSNRDRYPAVYRTEGFGGSLSSLTGAARRHYDLMKTGQTPPMIRVFLDHSSPWGTHEFADSVNNGPWGLALTEELIPHLESQYRMDGKASGRFTTGHSSGGWFAIWQQVRYPDVYGGTWARAPDPVDFRSFTGIDLYREGANAYTRPDGKPQYLMRDAAGKEITSFKDYTQYENVLGDYGGQIDSFDWVFSPRGNDGRPQPLFDRVTGKIDPTVARYWRDHFDISWIIRRDWTGMRSVLDGKIHLIMGTLDTFHLDEAARLLEQELKTLGARHDFMWIERGTHGNLDRIGDDPNGLEKKIAWEMWGIARPDSRLRPPAVLLSQPAQPAPQ
jgi:hypothetical protein